MDVVELLQKLLFTINIEVIEAKLPKAIPKISPV